MDMVKYRAALWSFLKLTVLFYHVHAASSVYVVCTIYESKGPSRVAM